MDESCSLRASAIPLATKVALILGLLAVLVMPATSWAAPLFQAEPPDSVSFPGDYAPALGGTAWAPDDPVVQAADEDDDGVWTLSVQLPGGRYEFKAALNGEWELNYGLDGQEGGENVPLDVPDTGGAVTFYFDQATLEVYAEVEAIDAAEAPSPVRGDGLIERNGLYHQSRLDLYRTPFGAVPAGSDVTLRFRTYADDVERVFLLLVDESSGARLARPMEVVAISPVAGEEATAIRYAWWETTINTGDAPTIHTYSFEIVDGETVLYYVDDGNGGAGRVETVSPAAGAAAGAWWDIYTYVPGFESPDWAKNAVIYQIFPDRFRNGRPQNDPAAGDWFYPEERGRVFPVTPWNTIVPDPQPNDPGANPEWYATWNSTFYGGDLQGILQQLDYLQALGVTTLYFNPIFEAPSNHRYDGRTFDLVDDALGIEGDHEASLTVLEELAAAAAERGMNIILDGVPNHLSSDAYIFDRYARHEIEGACEAQDSDFRDWFFFNPAQPPGSGVCAGDTMYEQWAGVHTLPQLDNTNEDVIANWLGPDGVATRWLQIPGLAGWRIDVVPDVANLNPRYFERFRESVKAAHPDAMLYSETWQESDVRARVLGDEFDSTMNYRFRSAVLGFLRDEDWQDGDGAIAALLPSEFDAALRAIEEDYPPAAWQSAMNLIGSHDVNRAVRVLDHDAIDYETLTPLNDFEDGRRRLRLASVLQFTLPGAPTIYYGDEVGLVGFGSDIPRDDPYNRQPYPWPDEAGYEDLPTWRQADGNLLNHYQFLGQLRAQYSFLRTGDWVTFTTDDEHGLYVYGRRDESGAAVVAVNRGEDTANVELDLTGFIPLAATLVEAASGDEVETPLSAEVGPMDFAIWITAPETDMSRPATPAILSAEAGEGTARLEFEVDDETATGLIVWRSAVDGGYEAVGQLGVDITPLLFLESNLRNGAAVYYRVTAIKANGIESEPSAPVRLVPGYEVDSAFLEEPLTIEHTISAITPTVPIQGRIVISSITGEPGQAEGLVAQVGLLAAVTETAPDPADIVWYDAQYMGEVEEGEVYTAQLIPEKSGDYLYGWRFSTSGGENWVYADASGIVEALPWPAPGQLTVAPSEDDQAPNRPFRIEEIFASPTMIAIGWRVSRTADLHHYLVCRRDVTAGEDDPCAGQTAIQRNSQVFSDTAVLVNHVYEYTVQAVDTSFNHSEPSDTLVVTATENFVEVTFQVRVPDFTPAGDVIYIAGDNREVFGSQWTPVQPMTEVADNVWAYTATVKSGTPLQYKYTRGSWESVEQWGSVTGMANRPTAVIASPEGTQTIDNTATDWGEGDDSTKAVQNWRDPLVVDVVASAGTIAVTFNAAVVATGALDEVITVAGADDGEAIPGSVTQTTGTTVTFTPAEPLPAGSYIVTVFNVATDVAMIAPFETEVVIIEE